MSDLLSSTALARLPAMPFKRQQRGEYGIGAKAFAQLHALGRSHGKTATITEQFKDMLEDILAEGYSSGQAAAILGNLQHDNELGSFSYDPEAFDFERTDDILDRAQQRVIDAYYGLPAGRPRNRDQFRSVFDGY